MKKYNGKDNLEQQLNSHSLDTEEAGKIEEVKKDTTISASSTNQKSENSSFNIKEKTTNDENKDRITSTASMNQRSINHSLDIEEQNNNDAVKTDRITSTLNTDSQSENRLLDIKEPTMVYRRVNIL